MKTSFSKNYPKYCLYVYLIFWIILAIKPTDRFNWFLENILAVAFILFLVLTYKKLKLSNKSYTLILIFMILHTIGAHYSYSQTPFFSELFGQKLQRDNYDRLTHFTFGLLFYLPFFDAVSKLAKPKGFWRFFFPFAIIIMCSSLYEIFEWLSVIVFTPERTTLFLGAQGDLFDTQKDMMLASIGAFICATITFFKSKA